MYGKGLDGAEILNPGLLRHQITWQRKLVTGTDSFGVDVYQWDDFLPCRARVESTNGKEFAGVMQRWAEADFMITQHFSKGLSTEMRIAWLNDDSVTYLDVLNIDDPPGTRRYQTVVCRNLGSGFTASQ